MWSFRAERSSWPAVATAIISRFSELTVLPMLMRSEESLGRSEQCFVWDEVAGWEAAARAAQQAAEAGVEEE